MTTLSFLLIIMEMELITNEKDRNSK